MGYEQRNRCGLFSPVCWSCQLPEVPARRVSTCFPAQVFGMVMLCLNSESLGAVWVIYIQGSLSSTQKQRKGQVGTTERTCWKSCLIHGCFALDLREPVIIPHLSEGVFVLSWFPHKASKGMQNVLWEVAPQALCSVCRLQAQPLLRKTKKQVKMLEWVKEGR